MSPLRRDYRQSEYSIVSVGNTSLPGQGGEGAAEQENLNSLPTEAGNALAMAPRLAGCSLPNYPLPTCFISLYSKPDPLRRGD